MATSKASRSKMRLTPADVPGLFYNSANVLVDESGVAVSFKAIQKRDKERFSEIGMGEVETPAELMRAAAFDPRLRLDTRLRMAEKAAPYFDRRMPLRIVQEGADAAEKVDPSQLLKLPKEERMAFLKTLSKLGIQL